MRFKRLMTYAMVLVIASLVPGVDATAAKIGAATKGAAAAKPVVYFGVSLRFHPITIYERYQPMLDYLTSNTPYRFELKIGRDYRETLEFLTEGKTDVVSIGDGGLMKAILLAGAVPVVKPLNPSGKPFYRSCLIVPNNSPIRALADLKGKRLALGYHHSTTGNLVPRDLLVKNGVKLTSLGALANLRHHSDVARAVLKGEYDAGFVKESTARRFFAEGLRVVYCSPELPSIPLLVRRDAPRDLAASLTAALTRLNPKDPAHRKIMESWDTEYQQGFVPAKVSQYRELVGMFQTSKRLGCGSGCH